MHANAGTWPEEVGVAKAALECAVRNLAAKLLEGKRGLIVGIANENSIAWSCAKAFRVCFTAGSVATLFLLCAGLEK
jgi:enoyl-[acyl-carrier-protein] reductase (NADH)